MTMGGLVSHPGGAMLGCSRRTVLSRTPDAEAGNKGKGLSG